MRPYAPICMLAARCVFWHCPRMTKTPPQNAWGNIVVIAGQGNGARAVALSLAAAHVPVAIEPQLADKAAPGSDGPPDWQSVLALSPAARHMLESLRVWQALDRPSSPICDMQVFGRPSAVNNAISRSAGHDAGFLSPQLGFAAPGAETALGHIVSLAALGRALDMAVQKQIEAGTINVLPAALADYDMAEKTAELADGTTIKPALLVDLYRRAPPWRRRMAALNLTHDYHAAALVGHLKAGRPHGQLAAQIFLPDGPMALLPLPAHDELALVWSLPRARAHALAKVGADILAHELARASEGRFGPLTPIGEMAVQDLHLSLAQEVTGPAYLALGDAAHIIHPLAGQGFNLSLRDAAALADTLYEARALGLPFDDATMLAGYARDRQADAALTGAVTHSLARLFQGPLAPLGRLGLGLVGRMAERRPTLRAAMTAQANAGVAHSVAPRLMRGDAFPHGD